MKNINIGVTADDGTGAKLRNAFETVNANFQELTKNYKELVAFTSYSDSVIAINTPLIIGNTYYIDSLQPDDDFSNVGYTGGNFFVATGEYPTSWNSTGVKLVSLDIVTCVNTFDNVSFEPYFSGGGICLKVTTEEVLNDSNTVYDFNLGDTEDGSFVTFFDFIFELIRYI